MDRGEISHGETPIRNIKPDRLLERWDFCWHKADWLEKRVKKGYEGALEKRWDAAQKQNTEAAAVNRLDQLIDAQRRQVAPTLVAFWLAVCDAAQLIGCASEKKRNVAKLWWKLAEIEVPPLAPDSAREIAMAYLQQTGTLR